MPRAGEEDFVNLPRTKVEYDLYMQCRISLDDAEEMSVYDIGFNPEHRPEHYYQLTADSEKVWFDARERRLAMCIPIDPRWDHDQNRSPYRYRDEYRGEPETWGPVSWDDFQA